MSETSQARMLNWPVILFLAAQTAAGIWWASGMSSTLNFVLINHNAAETRTANEIRDLRDDIKTLELKNNKYELEIAHLTDLINNGWRPAERR